MYTHAHTHCSIAVRSQSIQENQKSHELDLNISGHSPMGSPIGNKRKEPPPTPPTKKTLSPVRAYIIQAECEDDSMVMVWYGNGGGDIGDSHDDTTWRRGEGEGGGGL